MVRCDLCGWNSLIEERLTFAWIDTDGHGKRSSSPLDLEHADQTYSSTLFSKYIQKREKHDDHKEVLTPSLGRGNRHHDQLGQSANSTREYENDPNYFRLDTRLDDMTGIIKTDTDKLGGISEDRKPGKRLLPKHQKLIPSVRGHGQSKGAKSNKFSSSVSSIKQSFNSVVPSDDRSDTKRSESAWSAPESWGVMKGNDSQTAAMQTSYLYKSTAPRTHSKSSYAVRVFRTDGTFTTISCTLDATVPEILQILGRKFFLPSVAHYQIGFRRLGLVRVLKDHDHPLMLQKRMLELAGYTEEDRLSELGLEDLGYLCRFLFMPAVTALPINGDDNFGLADRYAQVDLQRKNLQTLPAILFEHASEILSLNLSSNLSLEIPVQFIKLCVNLREVKFAGNECATIPSSILHLTNLNYLDVSSNRLKNLDDVRFDQHEILVSLKLQNNSLSEMPESIVHLRNLRHLNLAFNEFKSFPLAVCNLVTLLELDISFNEIDDLPPEIGQLCALEKFVITNNSLKGSLPDTFQNLSSLKSLDIRYNNLQNLDNIMNLPRLEVLMVSHNSVPWIEQYSKRLRVLNLNQNPVTNVNFLLPMLTLTVLNLANAKMSSFPEKFFDKVANLEKLILDNNHFGSIPSQISKLRKLTKLSCANNNLSSLPPEIGSLPELEILDLHNNTLSNLPPEIWQLTNLETLNASSNELSAFPLPLTAYLSSISEASVLRPIPSSDEFERYKEDPYRRRPSNFSNSSGHSPRDTSGRRGSAFSNGSAENIAVQPLRKGSVFTAAYDPGRKDSTTSSTSRLANTMAQSLKHLSLADNQLTDDCLKVISFFAELTLLNLSYNYLFEIPSGALGRLTRLQELYLSGNNLTNLPADDLIRLSNLRVFHLNANKLLTLPAELAEINQLLVLDVGSNSLKYNISNWPYDWNWNYNPELTYLNLSGNIRLEIKPSPSARNEIDLADFSSLSKLRVLGLMDVTLTNSSVPDQTEDRRVRTAGSEIQSMPYGMADTLGCRGHLSTVDLVSERFRGNEDEVIFGLFDGQAIENGGNKVATFVQENFTWYFQHELSRLRDGESVSTALRRTFLLFNKEIGSTTFGNSQDQDHTLLHRPTSNIRMGPEEFITGTCATVAYIAGNKLCIANVGDSRAILSRTDGEFRLLTKKHEPAFSPEIDRIREAGGYVSQNGKLNDVLDVSRSIGYFNLIPCVQAAPHMIECELSDTDDLLIIASRELWEYITYQSAVDIAASFRDDPMRAAQKLRDIAISYGTTDKLVVMIIAVGDSGKKPQKSKVQGVSIGQVSAMEEEELFPVLKMQLARNYPEEMASTPRSGDEVPPPVGELAMVFTDIKNSTLLWETYSVAMRSAIKIHNVIMRRQLRIVGGYEVKTEGDAFMVCFPTATAAMLWCFSVQSQLLVAEWPAEIISSVDGAEVLDKSNNIIYRGLSVRMGMHWGAPVCERDPITRRMDYFGPMVNRTSRISSVADGGQISVSQDFITELGRLDSTFASAEGDLKILQDVLGDENMAKAVIRDLKMLHGLGWEVDVVGEHKLKGLESPEFISFIYPKSLIARMTIKSPSTTTVVANQLQATDVVWLVRSISLRLERICSYLNGSEIDSSETGAFKMLDKSARDKMPASVGLQFFDQLVTRIENALSTLYIRSLSGPLLPGQDRALADIFEMYSHLKKDYNFDQHNN
ncbi:hypothetical protein V1514DRAFT_275599 [Lipomyces japonicus]|uniref:uncharacterized protein n=1 Tax=Lipomyces japonicus TaxID=56871 RepID=UPI0034CEEAEF